MPMVAWYVLSKESYMKRVIRDVLPTVSPSAWHHSCAGLSPQEDIPLCSPRNTSLRSLATTPHGVPAPANSLELLQRIRVP
jgi:hypothetical protein